MRLLTTVIIILITGNNSLAQEHKHPVQDIPLHEKFYKNWMRPDAPEMSCCNLHDCYPTIIKYVDGKLYAQRREDKKWLYVAPNKIEMHRDNPDGRSHMCAPPPGGYYTDMVFCFTLGTGG